METRITTPEILACIDCWIAYNCIHVKNVNKDTPHTGYLRHAFEADVGIHISNEDFALAMYRAGYKCSRDGNHWNISKKCIAGSSITLAPYFKHSKYGHVSEDNIIAAHKRGIRYPFFTDLRRSGTPEFYGHEIDDFEIELDLYGYVPVMVYTLNEGHDLDWMILKNLRENKEEYYLIHPEKYKNPIKVTCLGDKWVSNAEYDMSHSRYNNDYFGEFDHDNKYTRLSLEFLERKARAGVPIHAGWFKIMDDARDHTIIDHSKLDPFIPIIIQDSFQIGQSVRNKDAYLVLDQNKDPEERALECIAIEWLTDEERTNAPEKYSNDYCGELYQILNTDSPEAKEGIRAGKTCFGWFKII